MKNKSNHRLRRRSAWATQRAEVQDGGARRLRGRGNSARPRLGLRTVPHTISDFCGQMQQIVPAGLEQPGDNVGLMVGDSDAVFRRALLAIDLSRPVADEAIKWNADLLLIYHPPIYKPITSLRAQSSGMEALVLDCIRAGMAIYSPHTRLDAAPGGTNDVLAEAAGANNIQPLVIVDSPGPSLIKVAVYVPQDNADAVAQAMFDAGAGHIGKYSHCSFRAPGTGTFLGGPDANPAIGVVGRLERVDEVRLETILPRTRMAAVVHAMRNAHPYEEPAFDLYSLTAEPTAGIGRVGELPRPVALSSLAKKLARATGATNVLIAGRPQDFVRRVIVVAGAAGSLPFQHPLEPGDVIITGELRHHDALTIRRIGCGAIALGHWASERLVLGPLASRLAKALPHAQFRVSRADADPFQ